MTASRLRQLQREQLDRVGDHAIGYDDLRQPGGPDCHQRDRLVRSRQLRGPGAGRSVSTAYGVVALSGSNLTLTAAVVTAGNGSAGANGAGGTAACRRGGRRRWRGTDSRQVAAACSLEWHALHPVDGSGGPREGRERERLLRLVQRGLRQESAASRNGPRAARPRGRPVGGRRRLRRFGTRTRRRRSRAAAERARASPAVRSGSSQSTAR